MKIAISSLGNKMDSKMDERFGRCSFFALYNKESKEIEFLPNPNKDANSGAGPATVQFLVSKDVDLFVSGNFGGKVKDLVKQLKIEVLEIENTDQTIDQVINTIN